MALFNPRKNAMFFYMKRQRRRRAAFDLGGLGASYFGLRGQFATGGRTRFPAALTAAIAAKRYTSHKVLFISDDDYTNNFYLYGWNGYTKTDGVDPTETNNSNSIDIVGASVHAFISGAWQIVTVMSVALANPITVAGGGLWKIGPFRFAQWVPPETQMSVILRINLPSDTANLPTNHVNRLGTNEGAKQTTVNSDFDLTATGALGGADGRFAGELFAPSLITCEHRDGLKTPVFWGDGDSLMWGKNTNENNLVGTTYGSMGPLALAMDSKLNKSRYPFFISAIPGVSAGEIQNPAKWAKRLGVIRQCANRPYTHIITNHVNNSGGTYATQFRPGLEGYINVLRSESRYWGDPECPIYHTGVNPRPGTTNFATSLAGQGGSGQDYPTAARWLWEADMLAGLTGIDEVIKNERIKYDLANERDRWALSAFATAVSTGGFAGASSVINLDADPGVGGFIVIDPGGGSQQARHVLSRTGTGPYACTMDATVTPAFAAGTVVKGSNVNDSQAVHYSTPGAVLHSLDIAEWLGGRFG